MAKASDRYTGPRVVTPPPREIDSDTTRSSPLIAFVDHSPPPADDIAVPDDATPRPQVGAAPSSPRDNVGAQSSPTESADAPLTEFFANARNDAQSPSTWDNGQANTTIDGVAGGLSTAQSGEVTGTVTAMQGPPRNSATSMSPASYNPQATDLNFGIGFTYGRVRSLTNDVHFSSHDANSFALTAQSPQAALDLYLMLDDVQLKSGHEHYDSINPNLKSLSLGARLRVSSGEYLTPYFVLGIGWTDLAWNYRNAISTSDGSVVDHDSVSGTEIYLGVGIRLSAYHRITVSAEIGPRVTLWEDTTYQGFENNVFRGNTTFLSKLEASVVF